MHNIIKQLAQYFTRPCVRCLAYTEDRWPLCLPCRQALPTIMHPCPQCGIHCTTNSKSTLPCVACLTHTPYFDHTVAPFLYRDAIAFLITQLKFKRKLGYANLLAQLLCPHIRNSLLTLPPPQCLLPVPLHRKRIQQRGFNQAQRIARYISQLLNIPCCDRSLIRQHPTQPQVGLSAKQRVINVQRAFYIQQPITVSCVALIDDVMTTGQTVNSISRLLKRHGVQTIYIWCIARASLNYD